MSVSLALSQPELSLGSDMLGTPSGEAKSWSDAPETPINARSKRSARTSTVGTKGGPLTLRDQEKHIDNLKKENFSVKLRVHFLEEQLAKLAPDQMDAALKQNINLKIEVQQRGMELKKLKKLVLELERELDRLQRAGGSKSRERELEEKLEERERELKELRRRRSGPGADDDAFQELEARNMELEEEISNARSLLEENMDEIERLREIVERRADGSVTGSLNGEDGTRDRLRRRVGELEDINEELRTRLDEHAEIITRKDDEKEDLADENDALRLEIEDLHRRREAESYDRSASRAQILEEREEREAVEEDLNALKDKLAAVMIELQQKEDETEMKNHEIDDLAAEHQRIIEAIDNDWRSEVEEARGQVEELRDVLAERDSECKELRLNISEQEAISNELRGKYEAAIIHLEELSEQKDAHVNALKEKLAAIKTELHEMTDMYEACNSEIHAHRSRQEELARHIEDLVEEARQERLGRERAEANLETCKNDHEAEIRRDHRLLSQRESDLQAVQTALQTLETESKKLGETHTTARFSLQLETDRLKRDLERVEDDLARARKDLDDRDAKYRDRESVLDKLYAENRDMASQLASQTQARLNISEKLDGVQNALKTAENDAAIYKAKATDLEQRLSKDQRALLNAESQYRDQLTERNTLLLTIYQYLDKIAGVDKTPKKSGQAETKPFTNFAVFHDNLITRLKALSQIQLEFERQGKDIEAKFTEKLTEMRKQLDNRWKQIDKFEASVKVFAETKATWRRKLAAKEGELEAIKTTNIEMASQLSGIKRPGQSDAMEVRSLSSRAVNAERRLNNAQNQLLATEEKITAINQKSAAAETKWEARVKEYETRLKTAEERVKRERQGSKERVAELENNLKTLQQQLELVQKHSQQLTGVIEANKVERP